MCVFGHCVGGQSVEARCSSSYLGLRQKGFGDAGANCISIERVVVLRLRWCIECHKT